MAWATALCQDIQRGMCAAAAAGSARVTFPAPHWSGTAVLNDDFEEISLDQFKGKYLVFFFYPNDFTFVCPTEIIAFSEHYEEFKKIDCNLVACSCDSHYCHLAWTNTARSQGGLGRVCYPLLADNTKKIAQDYGVLLEDQGIALRALFIIDKEGVLRSAMVNDIQVGRSVDEVLRLVKAFQYTDIHGEVCPEGWNPSADAISRTNSVSYFEKNYKDGE